MRLKPKLTIQPDPDPVPAEPAEVPVDEESEPEAPPPEPSSVKLKIKLPTPAAEEAAEEAVEEPVAEEQAPSLPPFPVVPPPPPEEDEDTVPPILAEAEEPAPAPRPSPVPVPVPVPVPAPGKGKIKFPAGAPRPAVFVRQRVPAALVAAERRRRLWKFALVAVGGVFVAAVVIGGAYLKLADQPLPTRVPPPAQPRLTPEVVPEVATKPAATKPAPAAELPSVDTAPGVRVASTATVELAPGVLATTESIRAVPNASSSFRSFVAGAKISGVYAGRPPRAFINGRLVRTGEMVDEVQEIYFDSIDVAARSLVFKDSSGATVSRRY